MTFGPPKKEHPPTPRRPSLFGCPKKEHPPLPPPPLFGPPKKEHAQLKQVVARDLSEEKKLLDEIKMLKKNRSKVNQVQQMEQILGLRCFVFALSFVRVRTSEFFLF